MVCHISYGCTLHLRERPEQRTTEMSSPMQVLAFNLCMSNFALSVRINTKRTVKLSVTRGLGI